MVCEIFSVDSYVKTDLTVLKRPTFFLRVKPGLKKRGHDFDEVANRDRTI